MKFAPSIVVGRRVGLAVLAFGSVLALPGWAQTDNTPASQSTGVDNTPASASSDNAVVSNDRMLTPPPVSGQTYPMALSSEERSNYLRGGLNFTSAYTDNALGGLNATPVSDVSYSVYPSISLNESTSRMHSEFTYAPGFTFYQRITSRNEADQNASVNFQYRLSPHVTFSAVDSFQKSSNVFNQPDLGTSGAVTGAAQGANFSVIAPLADRLSNFGNVGLTYQFARNAMVGASGTFSILHYPNPAQVPGLGDSSSQGGSAFYSLRISRMHYIGASYQYQRLMSYPTGGQGETQTHTAFLFYTVYPTTRFSISFFGGPQYSDTIEPPFPPSTIRLPEARAWTPAAGASLSWQGRLNSFSMSYSHTISGGGGLIGAVHMDSGTAAVRQQITSHLSGSVGGSYVQNKLVGEFVAGSNNGHSVSGTASLQQQIGEHLSVQLGYTRLHQDYSSVTVLSANPNTNREFVSLSYQFSRPIGR